MNEEVLNDLYSRAQYNGYKKSKDEFKTLLYSNEEVLNDNFEYVKSNGYQKSIDDFKVLIGSTEGKPTNFTNGSQEPSSPSASAPQSTSPKVEEVPLMLQGKTPEDKYVPTPEEQAIASEQAAKAVAAPVQNIEEIKRRAEEQNQWMLKEEKNTYDRIQQIKQAQPQTEEEKVILQEEARALQEKYFDIQNQKEALSAKKIVSPEVTASGFGNAFMAGLASLNSNLAYTPELVYDVAAMPQNIVTDLITLIGYEVSDSPISQDVVNLKTSAQDVKDYANVKNRVGEYFDKEKAAYEENMPKFERGIVDAVKDGNYAEAAHNIGIQFTQSLPYTLSAMAVGGVGGTAATFSAMAVPSASGRRQELVDNKDIPEAAKTMNALLTGGAEGIFESLTTGVSGKVVKDIVAREGKEAATKILKDMFSSAYEEALKKYPVIAGILGESAGEGLTQLSQNLVDIHTGVDPNKNPLEGVADATIVGGASGGAFGGITKSLQSAVNQSYISAANKRVDEIVKDPYSEATYKSISELSDSPARIDAVKELLQSRVNKGDLTQEQAESTLQKIESLVQTKNSIPAKLSTEKQMQAFNLIEERKGIEASIEGKDKAIVTAEKEQIDAINRELAVLGGAKREEGEVLYSETKKQQDNAVQEQSTTAIPLQPETATSEEMAQGEPQAEPKVTAEQGQEKNQEEVTLKTTNTNEENGIQEGGESGNEVISQGLQGEGKEGGQNVQEQEKALPQEVSSTTPTGIVGEETAQAIPAKTQPDALKDVEGTTKAINELPSNIFKYTGSKGKTKANKRGVTYLTSNRNYASIYESGTEKPSNKAQEELAKLKPPTKPDKVKLSTDEEIEYNKSIGEPLTPFVGIYQTEEEVEAANNEIEKKYQNDLKEYENTKAALKKQAADYLSPSFVYGKSMSLDIDFSKDSPQIIFDKLKNKGIAKKFKGGNFLDNYEPELKKYAEKNNIDYYNGIIGGISGSMNESPDEIILINDKKSILKSELSEAYHKAKADDSNPDLVAAVEEMLGQKTEGVTEGVSQVQPDTEATKEPLAEKYAKVESAKLQSTVTEDLKNGYTQKEIREALSEAGIDKAVSNTLISEAKQANALEKLTEVADSVSKSMKVNNLTKESFVELVKDLASKTKELQKVLEVLRKKPDLSKAEVMRINSLSNLEKLGKMGANELFDLIEQVNRSAERRGKNSKLKDLFKKLNRVKDLVGGKGGQIDIMTKTNPNIFTEEQIDRAIELLEPIVASGKNINAKQLKEASKGIKEILDEKDLLVKNENLLVNEALGQLQNKLGEDYDLEDFIEAMKSIYGLSEDDMTVKILASRESLKRAYRYFNNVSNPVDQKELEKEKEQNKEEKAAKKIEEIMSVRAIVQSKIAQLKSAKIMQMLKDNGFGLLELEDVNTLLNVSPETFSRLSLSDLNQLSNILDNLSDGFYNGISGRLVAKISGLDEVIKIEKRSKTIKSAIDRTKLDIINAIRNGRDKISAELGAAKDKEATAQRKAKQKLDIYYKTIGSMSNLFDVISRNVVRPVIDAVDAALSKADTFTVKVSKDFVEAMVNAKNKWDKDVSNSKFRKKVKEKYGFDPKSASPDLVMVMLTTELQHLANKEDKTSYPAKNIISVRGLAGIDDVNGTSYGGNQHLQELKEAFIDKDGVLDLKKTNEFLQEFGFDKPILKARELMKTMRPYAVTASMRNYGVALDAREDYTPRGQQGYTDTEQAILDLLSPESYGIGVNSPNLFARTATFGENVEWDFQKLITRYVDTIAKELYVKPVIRKNQVVVNELKQTGNSNAQTLAYVLEAMIETLKADGKPSSFATKNPTMYRLIQTLKLNILSSNFKYVSETLMTLAGQFVANPKDIVRGIQLWGKGFGKSAQEGEDILSKIMSVARGSSNSAAIFAIQERQIENREQIKTSTSGTVMPQESRTIVQRLTDSLKTSKFNQLLRDKAIKSNTKLQRNLDKIPRGVGWLGAFDRRFEELTGNKFDYDKIDDPAYIAENSDAISESQSHADTRVKKFVGPGSVREASMEFKERSPFTKDFQLWSLITSQEARDSIRKIARGISGKSEEEILQEVGDLTGYLVQSIGSRTAKAAIRLTIYSIVAEVAKRITGDDDDREKADKLLDKLTSPEFYAASLLAGIKDIALGGRNPFVRFMIDVAIERTYSMLFKEKQSKERKIDELEEQNLMDVSTVMGDFVTPPDLIRSYGAVGSVVSDIMRFGINYSSANEDDKAEKEYERKKLERAISEVHGENSDMLKVVNDSYEMQEQLQERLKKNDFVSEEEKTKAITNLKISQGVTSVLLRMVSATTGIPYYQDIAQVTSTAAEEWLKDSASKLRTINETINKEFYGDDYNSWLKNNKIISGTGWSLEAQKKAAKELKELNDKYSSMEQAGRFLNITDKVLKEAYKQ